MEVLDGISILMAVEWYRYEREGLFLGPVMSILGDMCCLWSKDSTFLLFGCDLAAGGASMLLGP